MKTQAELPVRCPKCGETPKPKNNESAREHLFWWIACQDCGEIEHIVGNKRSEFIEKWNRAAKKEKERLSLLKRKTY